MMTVPFYKNKHFLIPLATLAISLILGNILAFINTGNTLPVEEIPEFARQGWMIMIQVLAFFYLVYYAVRFFNRKYLAALSLAFIFLLAVWLPLMVKLPSLHSAWLWVSLLSFIKLNTTQTKDAAEQRPNSGAPPRGVIQQSAAVTSPMQ